MSDLAFNIDDVTVYQRGMDEILRQRQGEADEARKQLRDGNLSESARASCLAKIRSYEQMREGLRTITIYSD
nr:hypothetical protein [uncultured archaeon]AQS34122.1 hypothetical protein [uncultured archaeon]